MSIFRTHWGTFRLQIQLFKSERTSFSLFGRAYEMIRVDVALHQKYLQKVHNIALEDYRLRFRKIAEPVGGIN